MGGDNSARFWNCARALTPARFLYRRAAQHNTGLYVGGQKALEQVQELGITHVLVSVV